jgi:aqualysin 1
MLRLVTALLLLLAIISAATSHAAPPAHPHVVVLKDHLPDAAAVTREQVRAHAEGPVLSYTHALKGYAADIPEQEVEELRRDPRVAFVEPDRTASIAGQTTPWGIKRIGAQLSSTKAGDGRGRLRGVQGYVLDTGIDPRQRDLNLRRSVDFTGGPGGDCKGHGTHVAGTLAARDNARSVVSAAPGMPLISVKVLNCRGSGPISQIIRGIDWITAHARKPAVANMSLSASPSDALDEAVRSSARRGVFYAVAAGNQGAPACQRSPARAGGGTTNGIVTVAATDGRNRAARFSNYGSCVDVWAPGVGILSTRRGGGMARMSGTSMASPHVAGGAALRLSRARRRSPARVEAALKRSTIFVKRRSRDGRRIRGLFVGGF